MMLGFFYYYRTAQRQAVLRYTWHIKEFNYRCEFYLHEQMYLSFSWGRKILRMIKSFWGQGDNWCFN